MLILAHGKFGFNETFNLRKPEMNLINLNFFRSLKSRAERLRAWLSIHHSVEKSVRKTERVKINTYTLVEPAAGARKLTMMTLTMPKLNQSRDADRLGKSHWLVNTREQTYKPSVMKPDPQLEFIYDELDLASNLEPSLLTPPKQAS